MPERSTRTFGTPSRNNAVTVLFHCNELRNYRNLSKVAGLKSERAHLRPTPLHERHLRTLHYLAGEVCQQFKVLLVSAADDDILSIDPVPPPQPARFVPPERRYRVQCP